MSLREPAGVSLHAFSVNDPILDTLFLPVDEGLLAWPADEVAFLRARSGPVMQQRDRSALICVQSFKPDADALLASGYRVEEPDARRRFPLVLVLPPRQRDEARSLLAHAVAMTLPGGRVLACQSNNEGARSMQKDLEQLAGTVNTRSKNHCRVCWTEPLQDVQSAALYNEWLALDAPRPVADGRFLSRPGIFSWDRIDPASALLAAHLPANLAGHAADLGAGFGYLAAELLQRCPRIRSIHLYEAEARALELARHNLAAQESNVAIDYRWHDVTGGLPEHYDVIVTNPPFHAGSRHDRPDIGQRFIAAAAAALRPGGKLWLVANRHLPYELVLNRNFGETRTVVQSGGFKIIEATRSRALS